MADGGLLRRCSVCRPENSVTTGTIVGEYRSRRRPTLPTLTAKRRASQRSPGRGCAEPRTRLVSGVSSARRSARRNRRASGRRRRREQRANQTTIEAGRPAPFRRRRHELHPRRCPAEPAIPDGLTTRESEVLALIIDSLSNAEVAPQRFVTKPTAESHISHLFTKTRRPRPRRGRHLRLPARTHQRGGLTSHAMHAFAANRGAAPVGHRTARRRGERACSGLGPSGSSRGCRDGLSHAV